MHGDTLTLSTTHASQRYRVSFNPAGDQLTLKGGDLAGALTFTRRPQWRAPALAWLS